MVSFAESLAQDDAPKHPDGSSLLDLSLTEKLQLFYDFLLEKGIDFNDIGEIDRVSIWQGGPEGEPRIALKFSPTWERGPEWPMIEPAAPVVVKRPAAAKSKDGETRVAILPDPQVGFLRTANGQFVPLHDPSAIDTALSIVKDFKPHKVVWLGDYMDFAEFSTKFIRHPAFVGHTQTALDTGSRILGRGLSVTPEGASTVVLPGNHEDRLATYILQNAVAAFGLKRTQEPPTSWPVMSVPYLLNFEALGIEYGDAYPAGAYWLRDDIRAIHGSTVSSQGSSAATIAKKHAVSTIFGHVHRIEVHSQTWDLGNEIRECVTLTPGCLCAIDGAVPSASSAINPDGQYVPNSENWNQGAAFLTFHEDGGPMGVEIAHISNGEAFFRGTRYKSTVDRFDWEY